MIPGLNAFDTRSGVSLFSVTDRNAAFVALAGVETQTTSSDLEPLMTCRALAASAAPRPVLTP